MDGVTSLRDLRIPILLSVSRTGSTVNVYTLSCYCLRELRDTVHDPPRDIRGRWGVLCSGGGWSPRSPPDVCEPVTGVVTDRGPVPATSVSCRTPFWTPVGLETHNLLMTGDPVLGTPHSSFRRFPSVLFPGPSSVRSWGPSVQFYKIN